MTENQLWHLGSDGMSVWASEGGVAFRVATIHSLPGAAMLIVAAPELLAACKEVYGVLLHVSAADPQNEFYKQAIYKLEAAMKKAE